MADEPDIETDLGNESPLEGAGEIFGAIDEVLGTEPGGGGESTPAKETPDAGAGGGEGELGDLERPRAEDGTFLPKPKDKDAPEPTEKDKPAATDKPVAEAAKEKQYPETIKSPKARHEFDTLRQQRDDAQRKADSADLRFRQLETRFKDLESKSGTASPEVKVLQQKIEGLEKANSELDRIVSFKAVEETKAFREGVMAPQAEALDVLKQVAETYELDGAKLDAVLGEPNRFKRLEMLGDLTANLPERASFVKAELQTAVDKWVGAETKAAELRTNAKGNREYAEQERQQTEAAGSLERQKEFRDAAKEVIGGLVEKLPELSGDEATWNEILEKAGKVADFDKMPAKAKAFANYASYMIKPLITAFRTEKVARKAAEDALTARSKALPGAGGGRESTGRDTEADGDKSLLDLLNEEM